MGLWFLEAAQKLALAEPQHCPWPLACEWSRHWCYRWSLELRPSPQWRPAPSGVQNCDKRAPCSHPTYQPQEQEKQSQRTADEGFGGSCPFTAPSAMTLLSIKRSLFSHIGNFGLLWVHLRYCWFGIIGHHWFGVWGIAGLGHHWFGILDTTGQGFGVLLV